MLPLQVSVRLEIG